MTNRRERYAHALSFAEGQTARLLQRHPDFFPVYTRNGQWRHEGEPWTDWTGGFLTGLLWLMHHHTGDAAWRLRAEHYCRLLEYRQNDPDVHDLGFLFLNSFLPWYTLTGEQRLQDVVVTAGQTLAGRYIEAGGCLCSFIGPQSLFIDIMMNVPVIIYAGQVTGDQRLLKVARQHCMTTRDRLVRQDGSTAHEGLFELDTGRFLSESTHQGLRAESAWSRGLAWSLYGFSKVYALTGDAEALDVAERNADYWITHLPTDRVPPWDFTAAAEAPPGKAVQKDSSAGAIAASALLDLHLQTSSTERAFAYRETALAMLDALTTPEYVAQDTPEWEGTLLHGVYHTSKGLGVDESVMWGDYFFCEALLKALDKTPPWLGPSQALPRPSTSPGS